ncbi:pupal cuticle protein C1B-like [Nymphalis io]|uniref:pupal cuticle protein C1B-like n=1 Tax=Inachis io TaxID=171585 RepID=UPI0021694BF0|nr:pupal cuticle protein C1B-like [Nymphalis io]
MFKLVVLSCVLAATSASGLFGGYVAPIAPLAYAAPFWQPQNYRGPISLAPGQPANIIAADGRPLDTLDVNLDRSAHYTAKALNNGFHVLKKRSAAIIAPFAAPLVSPFAYSAPLLQPYNYRGPLSLAPGQPANILAADGRPLDTLDVNLDRSAHFTAKALNGGIHLLKKRSVAFAPISTVAVARTPLIAHTYGYSAPITTAHFGHPFAYAAAPIAHVL